MGFPNITVPPMSKGSLADPGHQQSLGEANVIQDPGVFVTGWKGFIANISCDVMDVKMVAKGKKDSAACCLGYRPIQHNPGGIFVEGVFIAAWHGDLGWLWMLLVFPYFPSDFFVRFASVLRCILPTLHMWRTPSGPWSKTLGFGSGVFLSDEFTSDLHWSFVGNVFWWMSKRDSRI